MGRLQRIDQLSEPAVVGQRYLVPAIFYPWRGIRRHWPVIGARHEDAEHLSFPAHHYHADWRFLSEAALRWLANDYHYMTANVTAHAVPLAYGNGGRRPAFSTDDVETADLMMVPHPPVAYRPMTMLRQAEYPRARAGKSSKFSALWKAFAGQTAARGKHGLVCPHRKFSLGSIPPDADGIVTCPLHGLRICAATGEVEPQSGAAA